MARKKLEPKDPNPKDAIGTNKVPMHLFPSSAIVAGAMALLDGACKYGAFNYRAAPVRYSVYLDALKRHTEKLTNSEDNDPESLVPHLGHLLADTAILIDAQINGTLIDDRPLPNVNYAAFIEHMNGLVPAIRERHADKSPKHYTNKDIG